MQNDDGDEEGEGEREGFACLFQVLSIVACLLVLKKRMFHKDGVLFFLLLFNFLFIST